MLDQPSEESIQEMITAEEQLIDTLGNISIELLVSMCNQIQEKVFYDDGYIETVLEDDRRFGQESVFSAFRVLKAIMAEIEYRIKENLI